MILKMLESLTCTFNVFLFVPVIIWVDAICTRAASLTPNWTGADLAGLTRFALSNAINRIMENTFGQVEEEKIKVNQDDLKFGIKERCATKNSTVNKLEKYRWITFVSTWI